jgi:hypothetical protein
METHGIVHAVGRGDKGDSPRGYFLMRIFAKFRHCPLAMASRVAGLGSARSKAGR